MRIAVSSDMDEPVARQVVDELRRRGHTVPAYGAPRPGDRRDRAGSAEAAKVAHVHALEGAAS